MPDSPESHVHAAAVGIVVHHEVLSDKLQVDRAGFGSTVDDLKVVSCGHGLARELARMYDLPDSVPDGFAVQVELAAFAASPNCDAVQAIPPNSQPCAERRVFKRFNRAQFRRAHPFWTGAIAAGYIATGPFAAGVVNEHGLSGADFRQANARIEAFELAGLRRLGCHGSDQHHDCARGRKDSGSGPDHRRLVLITIGVPSNPNLSRSRLIRNRWAEKCKLGRSVKTINVGGRTEAWV